MPQAGGPNDLANFHANGFARLRREFEATGDGRAALAARSKLIDTILEKLHENLLQGAGFPPEKFTIVAVGGYGRRSLFPHSDVDLLFLSEGKQVEQARQEAVAEISRRLWDLRLKVSAAARTLGECSTFQPGNPEFSVSLLDCRLLAGDASLFERLREEVVPKLAARERGGMIRALHELTRERHARHGNTIFHLEPNLKDAPGGLRDAAVARWLVLLSQLGEGRGWTEPEGLWPAGQREACVEAVGFLSAARCFLHFRRRRDDNMLTYELQDAAASLGIGVPGKRPLEAADWMRLYFERARAVDHLLKQLTREIPAARSSLYAAFESWRSRLSTPDFAVMREQIYLLQPAILEQPNALLRVFAFLARHGLSLSSEAQRQIEQRLERADGRLPAPAGFWKLFREILLLPHAAEALRAMRQTGLLAALFPELRAIDALVVRDFYHRYTVDEHSIMAVEQLQRLRQPKSDWERRFQEVFDELEQPELLLLTLLLHDIGKGTEPTDHVQGSVAAARAALARLGLPTGERKTVLYLIAHHLEMSATLQRRDISDPAAVRLFARVAGTPERLKMLCLLTYADIGSVNPEALTPWKEEMLWQLYVATVNDLGRSVDDERVWIGSSSEQALIDLLATLPGDVGSGDLERFLDGFPQRYLASHSAEQIARHYRAFTRLEREPYQLELRRVRNHYALTLVTRDRPGLFAKIAGTLYVWGMSITKAEAFASHAGVVLDTFHFVDMFQTLELNPSESERLEESLREVLTGRQELEALLARRAFDRTARPAKIRVVPEVRFDSSASAHSTILEVIAQDRPGLLYEISSAVGAAGCNIEVALVDTEGPKAIDTFYLTKGKEKLDSELQEELKQALMLLLE